MPTAEVVFHIGLPALTLCLLGYLVAMTIRRTEARVRVRLLIVWGGLIVWSLGGLLSRAYTLYPAQSPAGVDGPAPAALYGLRLSAAAMILLPACTLDLICVLAGPQNIWQWLMRRRAAAQAARWGLYGLTGLGATWAFVSISAFPGERSDFGSVSLVAVIAITLVVSLAGAGSILVRWYRAAAQFPARTQIIYVTLALVPLAIGLAIDSAYLAGVPIYPGGLIGGLAFAGWLGLATLRHELPAWQTTLREGVVVLLLSALMALPALVLALWIEASPLSASVYRTPTAALAVVLLMAVLYPMLRNRIRDLVDRLLFRARHRAHEALQRFIEDDIDTILDLEELVRRTLDVVMEVTQAQHAVLLLRAGSQEHYRVVSWRGDLRGAMTAASAQSESPVEISDASDTLPANSDLGKASMGASTELSVEASTESLPGTLESLATVQLNQSHPVISYLVGTGRLLTAEELEHLPLFQRLWPEERLVWERLGAQVLVPLCSRDNLIGILAIGARTAGDGRYPPEVLASLTQLTHHVAVVLESAQLNALAQQRLTELTTLHEISLEINAASETNRIAQLTTAGVLQLTGSDTAWILLLDEATGQPTTRLVNTRDGVCESMPSMERDMAFAERVFQQHTLVVGDVTSDPQIQALTAKQSARSLAALPLQVGEDRLGILVVEPAHPRRFDEHDLVLLEMLANQSAVAIKNTQLSAAVHRFNLDLETCVAERTKDLAQANLKLHSEKDRIEALYEIISELSTSLQLEEVLGKALRLVAAAVGAERGSVMVLGAQSSQLVYKVVLEPTGQVVTSNQPTRFHLGVGLAGWVAKHRQTALVADVTQDARWIDLPDMRGTVRAAVALPLNVGPDTLGVLFLAHSAPGHFSDEHLRVLLAVANEMAIAIHNAELYQYVSEQSEDLARMLREQEVTAAQSQVILEGITDGVIVNDIEGRILLVNPAAERVLGIHARAVEGQRWQNIGKALTPAGYADVAALVAEATAWVSRGGFQPMQQVFEIGDRMIHARLSPMITRSGEPLGVAAIFRDITQEREIERMKAEFVSTVSHELRTPLTSIKGYVDLVLDGDAGEISPDVRGFLQVVKTNSDRLSDLMDDLLDISRIEAGRITLDFVPLRLHEIIDEVLQNVRQQMEEQRLALSVDVPAHLPAIRGDRDRVVQIIANLISNAIKYTPPEGQVKVEAQVLDTHVQIDVSDTGIGIAPADQAKLFTKFFRADHPMVREAGGTGLGLLISKSLVELHEGQLWVESESGQGSTFSFTLPLMGRNHA